MDHTLAMENHIMEAPSKVESTRSFAEYSSRKGWLLRLFQSDFFNTWIAVSYLFRYPDIGIQYYLCEELKKSPLIEIEFILPQLWYLMNLLSHLLVTSARLSIPLENFLKYVSKNSTHIAILLLWYLETYIKDLKESKNVDHYRRCVRLLAEFQGLHLDTGLGNDGQEDALKVKIHPNLKGVVVGIGCLLASVTSLPLIRSTKELTVLYSHAKHEHSGSSERLNESASIELAPAMPRSVTKPPTSSPSLEEFHHGRAFSFKQFVAKAKKELNLDSSIKTIKDDPSLINSHYFYSEMQFVMTLVDISTRLVNVPKQARQKALQAELSLLNHNLPANICIPLWCNMSSDSKCKQTHHKVVRISPADAVVLNSAERVKNDLIKVPYLIVVEVLENESKEDLQALITELKDSDARRASMASITQSSASTSSSPLTAFNFREYRKFSAELKDIDSLEPEEFGERMRTAAIMLAQLNQQDSRAGTAHPDANLVSLIRNRIIKEMEALEKKRLEGGSASIELNVDQDPAVLQQQDILSKEDPSAIVFKENWDTKRQRIQHASPYGHLSNWRLLSVIVKSGADLRQEQLACQIIREMQQLWNEANLPLWICYYRVLVTSDQSGLIETVTNSISLHSIKKDAYAYKMNKPGMPFTLKEYFIKVATANETFGEPQSEGYMKAQDCFLKSLAGYSLVTYLLQVKDRHNGNILLDNQGHVIHIDFGFMLSNSPGYVGFETAPFKLTQEYIEILDGLGSPKFLEFRELLLKGYIALRKHADRILLMIEMMIKDSKFPCFYSGDAAIQHLRERFQLSLTDPQIADFIDKLIASSQMNIFTRLYDSFQYYSNGIL